MSKLVTTQVKVRIYSGCKKQTLGGGCCSLFNFIGGMMLQVC